MRVTCISDLHGKYPEIEGGDLLIVAGDLTAAGTLPEYYQFGAWLKRQPFRKKVVVGGNHDNRLQDQGILPGDDFFHCATYLCDSGTEFEGFKIWGSPWTVRFHGMNPDCMAFTKETDDELAKQWDFIPADTDILVTHGPPRGIFDTNIYDMACGSESLRVRVDQIRPKLHVFGHIHECGESTFTLEKIRNNKVVRSTYYVNASHMDEYYRPTNKPITVEL